MYFASTMRRSIFRIAGLEDSRLVPGKTSEFFRECAAAHAIALCDVRLALYAGEPSDEAIPIMAETCILAMESA